MCWREVYIQVHSLILDDGKSRVRLNTSHLCEKLRNIGSEEALPRFLFVFMEHLCFK